MNGDFMSILGGMQGMQGMQGMPNIAAMMQGGGAGMNGLPQGFGLGQQLPGLPQMQGMQPQAQPQMQGLGAPQPGDMASVLGSGGGMGGMPGGAPGMAGMMQGMSPQIAQMLMAQQQQQRQQMPGPMPVMRGQPGQARNYFAQGGGLAAPTGRVRG